MKNSKAIKLVLFFTKNMSLKDWDLIGMFDREVAIYKRLSSLGLSISFITYGGRDDLKYQNRIKGIKIYCNKWGLKESLYCKYVHLLHWKPLLNCNIIKTNQTNGSDIAVIASRFWNKKLIGRMGYLWSDFVNKNIEKTCYTKSDVFDMEAQLFNASDRIVVTTDIIAEKIVARSDAFLEKLTIIPNYVDTDNFKPDIGIVKDFDLIFIGRLSYQKNINALLEAIKDLKIKILIIGDGELKEELKIKYSRISSTIIWRKNIKNIDLPRYLNRSKIFILPSLYEGHPKVLIEAMSCGLPVIGADVSGIREIISHNYNGMLCDISSDSILKETLNLLEDNDLCRKLGENARKSIMENFSLNHILNLELNIYKSLI